MSNNCNTVCPVTKKVADNNAEITEQQEILDEISSLADRLGLEFRDSYYSKIGLVSIE